MSQTEKLTWNKPPRKLIWEKEERGIYYSVNFNELCTSTLGIRFALS